jgi:uncharacterized protein YdeI (YjbR/CyaY-like superfamily)
MFVGRARSFRLRDQLSCLYLCRREKTVQIKIFGSSAEFREWLETNHDHVLELWLGFYNQRTDKKSITYREALDEALCFGWIDGVRKSINETTYKQRFTPRKPKGYWSAVNIRRVGELAKLGRMAPSGVKAFERRPSDSGKYSFESRPKKLPLAYQRQFKAAPGAWKFFLAQAPWYQRTSSFWVVSAKQEKTRQRRLATLISDSEKGQRLGMLTPRVKKRQDSGNRPNSGKQRGQ